MKRIQKKLCLREKRTLLKKLLFYFPAAFAEGDEVRRTLIRRSLLHGGPCAPADQDLAGPPERSSTAAFLRNVRYGDKLSGPKKITGISCTKSRTRFKAGTRYQSLLESIMQLLIFVSNKMSRSSAIVRWLQHGLFKISVASCGKSLHDYIAACTPFEYEKGVLLSWSSKSKSAAFDAGTCVREKVSPRWLIGAVPRTLTR